MIQAVRPQVEDLGKQYSFTLLGKTLEEVTPQQEPREDHKANSITNNIPSTPTSLKGSRSGLSDLTKDTTPSSVEDNHSHHSNNTIQKNIYHDAEIDPLHIPESSNSTIKPLQDHAPKPLLSRVLSSNFPANSDQPVLKSTLQPSNSKPLVQIAPGSEASMSTDRRHTTPNDRPATLRNSIELSRKPRQPTHPIPRSTFPLLKHLRPDSSRAEMIRMRNSLINKKGNQKKKKDHFDDDNVLVGNKISEGHENFVMAYNMLTGIRVAVSRCAGIMKRLDEEDFKTTKKLSFNLEGNELTPSSKYDFKFKDYSPEVFRELRSLFGLDPADYLVSITGKYILSQLGSPGKSGSFFYYSRDYRYIIKTIHHSEHKQLRKILKEYYNFVKQNPNTLVCQFYGLHRVKMPFTTDGTRKVHFVVMNNLFPPHRDIHLKYDLKGSSWGRKTKVEPNTDISTYTLKDNNYLEFGQKINFGPSKRKIFFEQLEKDVKFLKKINVMDYSLLLGIHDVKKGNSFDLSQKLAVFDPKSANKSEIIRTNPRDINPDTDLPSGVYPGRLKYIFYGHDGGIRSTTETNDPSSEIYYMGIIDCLTNYSIKKRLETLWRSIGHSRSTISSVPSKEYGDRFYNFIVDGTCKIKRKFD